MKNNIQYDFNKSLYCQGTKGIEVGTSIIQGKYANQVIPNPFTIPNGDTIIGIHTVFVGESTYFLGTHTMTFAREIIIQAYEHHMKEKLSANRDETKKQISKIIFEMITANPRESKDYEFSNAILNYFALDNDIMHLILESEGQSKGFVMTICENQKHEAITMELDYDWWEHYRLNNQNSRIESSTIEQE